MELIEPAATPGAAPDLDRAWRELGPVALRLAAALVGPDDAPDITVTAFLRVTGQPGWDQIGNLRAYLQRAVRNEAHNLRRTRGRRWERDLAAVRSASHSDQPSDVDVFRSLAALTLRQRSVLFLAYWEDLTEAEIADTLGLSRGTVHRDLRRARERLRKDLA